MSEGNVNIRLVGEVFDAKHIRRFMQAIRTEINATPHPEKPAPFELCIEKCDGYLLILPKPSRPTAS